MLFSLNDDVYGSAPLVNGLYLLNCGHSILNIQNKKLKLSNHENPTYLWHCRLGHANEKRIARLRKLDFLTTFDFESYGNCEACLKGKMINKPFSGKGGSCQRSSRADPQRRLWTFSHSS